MLLLLLLLLLCCCVMVLPLVCVEGPGLAQLPTPCWQESSGGMGLETRDPGGLSPSGRLQARGRRLLGWVQPGPLLLCFW